VSEIIVCWKHGTGITGILDGRSTYLRCNILSGSPTFMILRRYTKDSGLHCKSMFWRRTDKRFAGESLNFVAANNWMVQCKDARRYVEKRIQYLFLRGARQFYSVYNFWSAQLNSSEDNDIWYPGGLAQLVERVLSMHEVGSSILPFSIFLMCPLYLPFLHVSKCSEVVSVLL
jgi:hypothetical protein